MYKSKKWVIILNEKTINNKKWQEYNIGIEIFPESQSKLWNNQQTDCNKHDNISLDPVKVQTFKTSEQLFFRTFSFVDRCELLSFGNYIESKKDIIINYLKKVDNHTNISQYQIFDESEFLNLIELKAISINPIQSFHKESVKNIHKKSKYVKNWKIDISKFYDSIYSHSFTWIYDFQGEAILNEIDKRLQRFNGRMTNGIPTGPIISKIISEILLTSIMLEIQDKINKVGVLDVHVYRFADDFCIYFNEETEFSDIAKIIVKILNKYKLSINKEKYLQNFSQDKELNAMLYISNISNYYDNDIEELDITNSYITLDNRVFKFQDEDFASSLIKKIVEEIGKIKDDKNLSNFYKIILKGVNRPWIIKHFLENKDSQLIQIFFDIIIHYINLNELQLNTPFMFIKSIFDCFDSLQVNNGIIWNIWNEFLIELARIYKKTKSEIKKIFIYDIFIAFNFTNIDEWLSFFEIDLEQALSLSHFLHISQLLESKKLNLKEKLIEILEKDDIFWPKTLKITKKIFRLSEEWIIWIYFTEEDINKFARMNLETKEKLIEIIKDKEKIKAFHYD